ncbi:MAG: TetR/AcrR family transcriptional regulator [Gammaproteobacteria bacterium]|mgnify:FL=1|jgi:AcrR family transcriptional regulator|tara:strand:+ start:9 stop:602 length:594 start_codon:yes stop_codon:yes gene_type:complete
MKYHHGDLKEALVQSACTCCEESGFEKISLRSIAKEANVSQTAPYRHFKTKVDLLAAVAQCGFDELREKMERSAQKTKGLNGKEQFFEMGLAYLEFGLEKQNTYDLMNHTSIHFGDYPDLIESSEATFTLLVNAVRRIKPELSEEELMSECIKAWAMIGGLVQILRKDSANLDSSAGRAIELVKQDVKKFLVQADII